MTRLTIEPRYMIAIIVLAVFTYTSLWFSYILRPVPIYHDVKKHNKHSNISLGFDHVYVISSSTQTERYERMKDAANRISLEFEFFPAMSSDDSKVFDEFKFDGELDPLHKASYITHYKIYQSIVNNEYEDALILDDNLDFELEISSIMSNILENLPADWELLHLSFCNSQEGLYNRPLSDVKKISPDYQLFRSEKTYCTNAYAVSASGASKLLKTLKPTKLSIELELTNLIQSKEITSYTILPPPIVQWHSHGKGNYGPHTLKKSTLNLVSKKSKLLNSTLGFDNIYVTNVSERPGRREKLESIAKKLNLRFEFFQAISQTNFDELKNFSPSSELKPPQKAHYLSHYKIYQSIVDHRYDSALILEDDIDFELNIVSIMTDTHRNLPADWEILYLGHCSELEGATNELLLDSNDISAEFKLFKSKRPYCTHAYAVSYVGALKMLQKLEKPTKFPIDIELVHMVEQGVIKSYTIVPPVISQWRISESSDMYPGRKTLDLLFLKNSTLYSLGLTHESNSTLGFGHIYVVNLPSRPDRREKLEILANKFNLKFDFVPAVSKDSEEAYVPPGRSIGPTHKACYLSHYKIYKSIDEHKYESALILEDDVDLELNIAYIITNVHKILPSDWDIFYLGFCSNWEGGGDPIEDKDNISPTHKLFHSRHPYCTHAYALSRTGIRKLLEKLSDEPGSPIDLELIGMISDKKLISYTVMPPLFIQWRSPHNPSDISPGSRALDFYFLKTSALHFIGLLRESNTSLGFNHIYAINQPDRKDRRGKLDSLSTRLYFGLDIVDAVSENDTKKLDKFSPKSQLKPSERAAYIDHYNIYKSIIDSKYGSALILEDNIDIELNISPIMTDVHQSLPSDWEMLYLGHCNNLEGKSSEPLIVKNKDNGINYKLFKSKKPYCTYAYAVSHAGALKLLETVGKPTTLPLDQELVNMIQAGKIKSYTLIPPIIVHWQFPNESPESSKVKSSDETSDFYTLTNSTIKFIG